MNLWRGQVETAWHENPVPLTLTGDGELWLGGKDGLRFIRKIDRPGPDDPFLRRVSTTRGEDPRKVETFAVEVTGDGHDRERGEKLRRIERADGSVFWDVAQEVVLAGGARRS